MLVGRRAVSASLTPVDTCKVSSSPAAWPTFVPLALERQLVPRREQEGWKWNKKKVCSHFFFFSPRKNLDTLIGFVKNLNTFRVFLGVGYISFSNHMHNGFVTVNVVYFFSPRQPTHNSSPPRKIWAMVFVFHCVFGWATYLIKEPGIQGRYPVISGKISHFWKHTKLRVQAAEKWLLVTHTLQEGPAGCLFFPLFFFSFTCFLWLE